MDLPPRNLRIPERAITDTSTLLVFNYCDALHVDPVNVPIVSGVDELLQQLQEAFRRKSLWGIGDRVEVERILRDVHEECVKVLSRKKVPHFCINGQS